MKNKATGYYLLISHILYVLFLPFWLFASIMAIFSFGPVEASDSFVPLEIIWSFPLFVLVAVIISWILYHKKKFKAAGWWNLLPFLWPVAVLVGLLTM